MVRSRLHTTVLELQQLECRGSGVNALITAKVKLKLYRSGKS